MLKNKQLIGFNLIVQIFLATQFISVSGQTADQVITSMNKTYASNRSIKSNISIKCFEKLGDDSAIVIYNGLVIKTANTYYSEMLGQTILLHDKKLIVINDENKIIIVSVIHNKDSLLGETLSLGNPSNANSYQLRNGQNNQYCVVAQSSGNPIDSICFIIDIKTYALKTALYFYKPRTENLFSKIAINYSDIKSNKSYDDSIFAESNFIKETKEGYVGLGKRSTYKVIVRSTNEVK